MSAPYVAGDDRSTCVAISCFLRHVLAEVSLTATSQAAASPARVKCQSCVLTSGSRTASPLRRFPRIVAQQRHAAAGAEQPRLRINAQLVARIHDVQVAHRE